MVGSYAARADRYPGATQQLASRFREAGHAVLLTSTHRRRARKLADMLLTLLRRRREFDIVLLDTYSTLAFWYACAAAWEARRLGKRIVCVLHGGALPDLARRSPGRVRWLLESADRVVAPSPYLAREIGDRLGLRVDVIRNPVEIAHYPCRVRTAARPRIFWLRAFRRGYLPETAVEAAALLRRRRPDLELTMAGPERDGSLARCRMLARRLGVEDAVRFPGMLDKAAIRRRGDASDIFLNTTGVDNTPVSVLEAMAMGLCIVSTRVGGIPDLLEDGETALLVPPGDPEAVADAILRILERPLLAERLSRNAARAVQAFDLERVAQRWYALFEELGGGAG